MIRIENLTKRFGSVVAVDDLTLEIGEGEFFSLLGASGCGKSTLLRLIAGLEKPDAGRILIDRVDVTDAPPWRRPVNIMFQSYALFPHMTAAENVAFGLKQDGLAREPVRERTQRALALVRMEGLARRRPHQLSGGQQQRVALGRALAKEPRILLLDEPLAALDRKLREATRLELAALQRRLGITFVMVSHDQEEVMSISSRVAVMDAGRIVQTGAPREVYDRPASRFVADFVGEANLFDGALVRTDGDRAVFHSEAVGGELVAHGCGAPLGGGRNVTLLVRPERICIEAAPPRGADNTVSGTVRDSEFQGSRSTHRVALASGHVVRVTSANAGNEGATAAGAAVHLSWPADAVVVLTA